MLDSNYYRLTGQINKNGMPISPDWPMAVISANIMTTAFLAQSSLNQYDKDGTLTTSAGFAATAMIPVSPRQVLYFYCGDGATPPASHGRYYDASLNLVANYTPNNKGTSIVPSEAAFARVNYSMSGTPFAYTLPSVDTLLTADWGTRYRITFAGDSITEGFGVTTAQRWPTLVAKRFGFTATNTTNLGVSGTTISTFTGAPANAFADRIGTHVVPIDTQVFIMKYGISDLLTAGSSLGTMGDTTSATIYGALDVVFKYMQTNRPLARCYCVKPLRANRTYLSGITIEQLWTAIDLVCSKYMVTVLDANQCGIRVSPQISALYGKYGGAIEMESFLHPGPYGHALIANRLYEQIITS